MYTVGHSTREAAEFLALLAPPGIATLVDVRRFPGSRRYPQFSREALAESLRTNRIAYRHLESLGGRRTPAPDSVNTGWRNASFRGYADYMQTPAFRRAIDELLTFDAPIAVMCAEAVWWRCHRSLIADYLTAMGIVVQHIGSGGNTTPHTGTSPAQLALGSLSYSGSGPQEELF